MKIFIAKLTELYNLMIFFKFKWRLLLLNCIIWWHFWIKMKIVITKLTKLYKLVNFLNSNEECYYQTY